MIHVVKHAMLIASIAAWNCHTALASSDRPNLLVIFGGDIEGDYCSAVLS